MAQRFRDEKTSSGYILWLLYIRLTLRQDAMDASWLEMSRKSSSGCTRYNAWPPTRFSSWFEVTNSQLGKAIDVK